MNRLRDAVGGKLSQNPAPDIGKVRSHRGRTGPGNAVSQGFLRRVESAFLRRIGYRTRTGEFLVLKGPRFVSGRRLLSRSRVAR